MIPRRARFKLAILLVLMLPVQSLSAMSVCGSHHCDPVSVTPLHHSCGTCCAVGIAAAPLRWAAPRLPMPEVSSVTLLPAPNAILDRLDRPPRYSI
jgi:hypothetical protein